MKKFGNAVRPFWDGEKCDPSQKDGDPQLRDQKGHSLNHLHNVQNPYDIPFYWLVYRDPCNGLLNSLFN